MFFWPNWAIFGSADVDFWPFLVPKRVSGASFFGVFSKTVILRKSCSRCGGSVVFQGRTLRKSVRRPTPNGDGEKNRRKSLPAPSPDAFFRSRTRFWSIFGPRSDPKIAQNRPQGNMTPIFWRQFFDFFAFPSLGRVPEGSRDRFWPPRSPPGPDFGRIFRRFSDGSAGLLPRFAGFRRDVAGIHRQPPVLTLGGSSGLGRFRGAV